MICFDKSIIDTIMNEYVNKLNESLIFPSFEWMNERKESPPCDIRQELLKYYNRWLIICYHVKLGFYMSLSLHACNEIYFREYNCTTNRCLTKVFIFRINIQIKIFNWNILLFTPWFRIYNFITLCIMR